MSEWTISFSILCFKCQQKLTEQDINHNNYQLILLPTLTVHHQVCPRPKPDYPPSFTYASHTPENTFTFKIK